MRDRNNDVRERRCGIKNGEVKAIAIFSPLKVYGIMHFTSEVTGVGKLGEYRGIKCGKCMEARSHSLNLGTPVIIY